MFAARISVFDRDDLEMRAALAAGWRRVDLVWERRQELANQAWFAGDRVRAVRNWRYARALAIVFFPRQDPRCATSLANMALVARARGNHDLASRRYARARLLWANVPRQLDTLKILPRARSSLFHLRMEAQHWETYKTNMKTRLSHFVREADDALRAAADGVPSPHRLYQRWQGEKPSVFDDTRKLLAAALLICAGPLEPRDQSG